MPPKTTHGTFWQAPRPLPVFADCFFTQRWFLPSPPVKLPRASAETPLGFEGSRVPR